jgi:ankyrin repeat protein
MLLHNGAEPNGEILLLVMEKQRFALAKQFIESGVDVNYQYPLSRSYADGMTPLLYASKWNNPELVKLLVEHGANINARSKDGNTALSIAQTNGNGPIYYYLLEHGAAEPGAVPPPPPNSGISGIFDNQSNEFQKGLYRLAGSDMYIRFLGNTNSGNINYIRNGMSYTGLYRIGNSNMTLIMEGRTFVYRIDSNTSFSGNGEVWVRTGN